MNPKLEQRQPNFKGGTRCFAPRHQVVLVVVSPHAVDFALIKKAKQNRQKEIVKEKLGHHPSGQFQP